MASTYISSYMHIVFATRGRAPMIGDPCRQDLQRYIGGTLSGLDAKPMIVGGVADHIHLLASLRATYAVADLVREVKKASSAWASG